MISAAGVHSGHSSLSVAAGLALVLLGGWSAVALWFQGPRSTGARSLLVTLWVGFALAALGAIVRGHLLAASITFAVAFALLLWWWHRLEPSNERLWADDVACVGTGEVRGDAVTLRNVRNFDWRALSDYTPRWETRSYDLAKLESLDLITSYWGRRAIAHVLVSFGFSGGEQLVFSVEIRRQRQQKFSELGGFFKRFELSVVAADERDVIRVRTNIRSEDDYLYRIRLAREDMRSLLIAYVEQMNNLMRTPRFYNTITVNCTTLVYQMMQRIVGRLPYDYRLLFSGYLPEYVYKVGGLDRRYTFAELRQFGRITARARLADRSAQFSQEIRRGIPALESSSATER
jgi:hypothetical protein